MKKFNYVFDVAFSVISEADYWSDVTGEELIKGLEARIAYLKTLDPRDACEAFGFSDSYEEV